MAAASAGELVWLITGTDRGVGLEMTRQLLESSSNTVIATSRSPPDATDLYALASTAKGTMHVLQLDVSDFESIRRCAQEATRLLGDRGIDYVVNNAAINPGHKDKPYTMDVTTMPEVFQTNVFGPAYISQVFLPLVEKSAKKMFLHISSTRGSEGADLGVDHASYSMSKAALNMLVYKQAKERPDITSIAMCPGWLKTHMGPFDEAEHHVSVGVAGILKTVASLTTENTGQFWNLKGERVPW
ncbi:NAD-P-binding protein [Earliella scabrosa]|nr:NAD-P-binding protein [Earliella scabrosa]